MDSIPCPGSKRAQELGCICPVEDNAEGEGAYMADNGPVFYVTEGCPIHDSPVKIPEDLEE